ncbi:MAG: hypothetical protein ACOCT9_00320 [archaeon]
MPLFGFDFTGKSKEKVRAQRFNMQDDSDRMLYERIHQNCFDKKSGWKVLEELNLADKYGNLFIFLRWTEPPIEEEGR